MNEVCEVTILGDAGAESCHTLHLYFGENTNRFMAGEWLYGSIRDNAIAPTAWPR